MIKLLSNKWVLAILIILLFSMSIYLKVKFPNPYFEPGFIDRITDRSQYYVRELLDYNFKVFSVMLDEVRANFYTFYLIIISGITIIIILTIQVIATITRLPIGYLACPGKYLVIRKSNQAQSILTDKGESK